MILIIFFLIWTITRIYFGGFSYPWFNLKIDMEISFSLSPPPIWKIICSDSWWWHRKILNSLPLIDTPNLQQYMEQIPLKKPVTETSSHGANERETTSKGIGKAETQSHHKPQTRHGDAHSEGNSRPGASFWGAKRSYPTWNTPPFKTGTWEINPPNIWFWKTTGLAPMRPKGLIQTEVWLLRAHTKSPNSSHSWISKKTTQSKNGQKI